MFRFVGKVAGQEKSSTMLVSDWEKAVEKASETLPPVVTPAVMHLLNAYLFDRVVDLVTPDAGIAADAKEELKLLEEIRTGAESGTDPQ